MRPDWAAAACAGQGEWFFGPDHEPVSRRNWRESKATAICVPCPLQLACLEFALAEGFRNGVWGGMTEDGRANLLRWRRKKASRDRARERRAA